MRTASRLVAGALLVATLAGCSGPHAGAPYRSVRDDVGSCAAVLPLARDSVADHGTLVAIHPLRPGQAEAILRAAGPTPSPAPPSPTPGATRPVPPSRHGTPSSSPGPHSCVIAYRGPYRAGELRLAPQGSGRFAVLILRVRHPAVRRLLVVDRLPPGV